MIGRYEKTLLIVSIFYSGLFRTFASEFISSLDPLEEVLDSKMIFAGEVLGTKTETIPVFKGSTTTKTSFVATIKITAVFKGGDLHLGKNYILKYHSYKGPDSSLRTDKTEPLVVTSRERYLFYVEEIYKDGEIKVLTTTPYNKTEECRLKAIFLWGKKEFKAIKNSGEAPLGDCQPIEILGTKYFGNK